ncbi:MAG: diguanylate cyclase [Bryobacterales bacterium]|nr:diguanylate cyclase [Bryobacterales bacterium]
MGQTGFSAPARAYLGFVIAAGILCVAGAMAEWAPADAPRFVAYLLVSVGTSLLKVRLPGIRGTMSVNFFFLLIAILELSLGETLMIGVVSAFAQTVWKSRSQVKVVQMLFNLAMLSITLRTAYYAYHYYPETGLTIDFPTQLVVTAVAYFVMNTLPVAMAIHLTEGKPLLRTWKETYFWVFSYYLLGAVFAGIHKNLADSHGWAVAFMILPVIYAVYRSYSFYIEKLESEKQQAEAERAHTEQVSNLHLRTIEALALAIEAKDQTTHDHLQRVQVYSVEMAKALGLPEVEIQAVRAASVLHDIGKLAVPEHIISKPGRLTPEEFEKMKIHPVVGAEILEHVQFPYPVVPIVRHHHERWDGTGYPDGIRGEEIPIGARILSAVDCFDALASDRQYRRALPPEEAMAEVVRLSGKSYDPRVVECLQANYKKWETLTHAMGKDTRKLSVEVAVRRGTPAAGYDMTKEETAVRKPVDFLSTIGAARHEAQVLHEMTQDMVSYLALDEMLSVVALRLKKLVPHDTFAVYLKQDGVLQPEFVCGDEARLFSSLRIPMGAGISGWVAQNRKPIVNGNPSVEPGYLNDPGKFSVQRSILSVPLESSSGVIGALTLVDGRKEAFDPDHVRILLMIASKLGQSVQNSLRYRSAEDTSMTDYLTGLPNARSLFGRLTEELETKDGRTARFSVLVCDLDGFKGINDRFGHLKGNQVLQEVAAVLKDNCRSNDYVARMGGDEFVMIAHDIHPNTEELVRRLVAAIEKVGRRVCNDGTLSASIGYAVAPGAGCAPEDLLARADKQMYAIKEGRRNTSGLVSLLGQVGRKEGIEGKAATTLLQ